MIKTCQSEYGVLKSVLLKHPRDAFQTQEFIKSQWQQLNYGDQPDFAKSCDEFDYFISILRKFKIQIDFLPPAPETSLDSIYVRDPSITTDQGIVLCNMGKAERSSEPRTHQRFMDQKMRPVLGKIIGEGTLEGGDTAWINQTTLAVARGYRTNQEGIDQLKKLLADQVEDFVILHAPHFRGPPDVFHLMSIYSPLDKDLALVSPLMAVSFREELIKRGIKLIETAEQEFETLGCNVLALSPRVCVMVSGNPITKTRLQATGVEVLEYPGEEISAKDCGGPTCLTRPLERGV